MKENIYTNVIITMAGNGSRFTKAGYKQPKFEILLQNHSLFYWSLISLKSYIEKKCRFIFITQKKHHAKNFIDEEVKKLNIQNFVIIELESETAGQAETAIKAKSFIDTTLPILIYNIDTHVNPKKIEHYDYRNFDGIIPCFKAYDDKWSFVRVDSNLNAIEVREKVIISDNATIGLYGFSSFDIYEQAYREYYSGNKNVEKNEFYVAPVYNQLISDGKNIKIVLVDRDDIINLGTPQDLEIAKKLLTTK